MNRGVRDIDNFLPFGIGANVAYGLHSPLANAYRCRLFEIEQDQFVRHWMYSLLRCSNLKQYEDIQKQYFQMVRDDPSLKLSAEQVMKDESLLNFRKGLPEDSQVSYDIRAERREAGDLIRRIVPELEKPKKSTDDMEISIVWLYRYRNPKQFWKESKIVLKSFKGTVPVGHVAGNDHLYLAYYVTEHIVHFCHYDEKQNLCNEWFCGDMAGPLSVHVGCVTDGARVYSHGGTHCYSIEGHIITSIEWYNENLKVGTLAGLVYSCISNTVEAVPNRVAVLSIVGGKAYQTLCSLVVDRLNLFTGRIVCNRLVEDGSVILCLNKQGVLFVRCEGEDDYVYNPPSYASCNIQHSMAYCRDALWVSESADAAAILYPSGQVGIPSISIAEKRNKI